jgi:hypothetical protein
VFIRKSWKGAVGGGLLAAFAAFAWASSWDEPLNSGGGMASPFEASPENRVAPDVAVVPVQDTHERLEPRKDRRFSTEESVDRCMRQIHCRDAVLRFLFLEQIAHRRK